MEGVTRPGSRLLAFALAIAGIAGSAGAEPIAIERQGGFAAGGTVLSDDAGATQHCDHGYVEFQIPASPRKYPLFLWHSSSALVWQQRWDGGEGYRDIFLRRGFPVYLWDGPRVGRANWGCAPYTYEPRPGRDQQNFTNWRFGPSYGQWFADVQFPTGDAAAFEQAMRGRYDEFDRLDNVRLEATAAAAALDRIGPSVLVTNSAGGLRALLAATLTGNVKAIVAYENPGYLFPTGEGPQTPDGPFGPLHVSAEEFELLTKIPLQFVWGDHIADSPLWARQLEQCQAFVDLVNARGGEAEILMLPEHGLKGNTHLAFMDMDNRAVADLLSEFLAKHGLDAR
jgi:hypothetical protein